MIKVDSLIKILEKNHSNFFTGVPDSILKQLSIYLQKKNKKQHIVASNEGAAISIGIGHYLSTKKIPCIYMQNSGLSNSLNPLISIANKNSKAKKDKEDKIQKSIDSGSIKKELAPKRNQSGEFGMNKGGLMKRNRIK